MIKGKRNCEVEQAPSQKGKPLKKAVVTKKVKSNGKKGY